MAVLETVNFQSMILDRSDGWNWNPEPSSQSYSQIPQIFFNDGEPWRAANRYAVSKLQAVSGNNIKTVVSNMRHLKGYAEWLEDNNVDWRDFPKKIKDRCLFRFRGFLIRQRDEGILKPSYVTARMNAVIHFYRWAQVHGWIERKEMWKDKTKYFRLASTIGFSRTMTVVSSELSIPNRTRPGLRLEDGLFPISKQNREILLNFLQTRTMVELYYIYLLGFFTGARSETIRTLRLSNIENALDDPTIPSVKRVAVGPPTKVKTKYNVSGHLLVPAQLVKALQRYAYSARRLTRQARASKQDRTLLFLTERGNGYSETTFTKLVSDLRVRLLKASHGQFQDMKFHQSRATYGTEMMRLAMNILPNQTDALVFVRDAMLHKDESTTWKYIKFIRNEPIKEKLSEEFFNLFTGKHKGSKKLIAQVSYDEDP